jgi:hypothetical protein
VETGEVFRVLEFPTHIIVSGKRYLLNEDPAVAEHNEKCMRGVLSLLDYMLPVGKRLRDVDTSELLEAERSEECVRKFPSRASKS